MFGGNFKADISRYDPATQATTPMGASFPMDPNTYAHFTGSAAVWADGYAYILGGTQVFQVGNLWYNKQVDTIYSYDPAKDLLVKTSSKLPWPMDFRGGQAFWDGRDIGPDCPGGCVYFIATAWTWTDTTAETSEGTAHSDIYAYNPQTGSVIGVAQLPTGAEGGSVVWDANAGQAYILGGVAGFHKDSSDPVANAAVYSKMMYQFDPLTSVILDHAMPMGLEFAGRPSGFDGECAYVFGANDYPYAVWAVNLKSTPFSWQSVEVMPHGLQGVQAHWVGDRFVMAGGLSYGPPANIYRDDLVLEYDPAPSAPVAPPNVKATRLGSSSWNSDVVVTWDEAVQDTTDTCWRTTEYVVGRDKGTMTATVPASDVRKFIDDSASPEGHCYQVKAVVRGHDSPWSAPSCVPEVKKMPDTTRCHGGSDPMAAVETAEYRVLECVGPLPEDPGVLRL